MSSSESEGEGNTPLYVAARHGREADVAALLADGADVDERMPDGSGETALRVACTGTKIPRRRGPFDYRSDDDEDYHPSSEVTKRARSAKKARKAKKVTKKAMKASYLRIVQLLSSYGASRIFSDAPRDTAEGKAEGYPGYPEDDRKHILAWLILSRNWTPLHHLEVLTPERALALLRDDADLHAAAGPGGPTPLDRAKELCRSGAAAAGSAAHVVMRAEMRRLWRKPLLLGTITGYWMHLTASPDSKAGRAALARCSKRARGEE